MLRLLWFTLLILTFTLPAAAAGKQGAITFTFDDASPTQYINAFRILEEHGFDATLYVVSEAVDGATKNLPGYREYALNWEEVRAMHAAGWEIGGHTHTHPHLTELDDISLFTELAYGKRRIIDEIKAPPLTFSSPFGDFDERVMEEVEKHYEAHVSWSSNKGINSLPVADPLALGRFEVRREYTVSQVCDTIERVASEGKWLILLFHHVVDTPPEEYQISTAMFNGIAECASHFQQAGKIKIRTITDMLKQERR